MKYVCSLPLCVILLMPSLSMAEERNDIASAESAAPASISKNATVKDWKMKALREGSNGWTCLPDNPDTPGNDPWCVNDPWLNLLEALTNKKKPTYTEVGIAYMLQGDTPVSNTDPFATQPKPGDDWVEGLEAHMMMLLPDQALLNAFPTDSKSGGPWVMWPNTPYAHLMLPIDSYPSGQ